MSGFPVRFRFHGELNDFLTPTQQNVEFEHPAGITDTIKHVIEALGVPHTEFERVTVNGNVISLSAQLAAGDRIQVFPHTIPIPLEDPRFIVDVHLGRLAAYLRMLGFDTWYQRFAADPQLASIASGEQRLLLTRDAGLLKRRQVEQGYLVRSDQPHDQLREVSNRFALRSHFAPFSRCMNCNGLLRPVSKPDVAILLPPHTLETKDQFSRCPDCGKVFWRGTHYDRMLGWIQELTYGDPSAS